MNEIDSRDLRSYINQLLEKYDYKTISKELKEIAKTAEIIKEIK